MPRIPQNLRERAIGILNAGITMNAFAMNIGFFYSCYSTPQAIFQTTGRTEDPPRSERPHVTTRGQDRHIRNTHLRNRYCCLHPYYIQQPYIYPNCAQSVVRGLAKCTSSICWLCFGTTSPCKSC